MENDTGLSPQASNCTESRLQKVVLPELEGPVISTSLTGSLSRWKRRSISSAICTIFFSWRASLTWMSSEACPRITALFTSPALDNRMMMSQRVFSANISKVFGCGIFSASIEGLFQSGTLSNRPSS